MYIASSQTNCQEICKMYLHWVCDRKLEGAAGEHLAPGVSTEEEAARHHAEDGGNMWQKTKEREKNEGKPKHFNDDSC